VVRSLSKWDRFGRIDSHSSGTGHWNWCGLAFQNSVFLGSRLGHRYVENWALANVYDTENIPFKMTFGLMVKRAGRQRNVQQLLAEGYSAKKIAAIMNICPRTMEFHKCRIMEEFNLSTNAELIRFAIKHGIVAL